MSVRHLQECDIVEHPIKFIKFQQDDPHYKNSPSEVVVAVGQITKIEPTYYVVDSEGRRFLKKVAVPGEKELEEGVDRVFRIFDSLGNSYSSETATDEGRKLIEELWKNAS